MEEQVSNILLDVAGHADGFVIKWGWFKFHLKIRPVRAKDFIKICGETCKIRDVNGADAATLFQAALKHGGDIKYIARSIAIATRTFHRRIITKAI